MISDGDEDDDAANAAADGADVEDVKIYFEFSACLLSSFFFKSFSSELFKKALLRRLLPLCIF